MIDFTQDDLTQLQEKGISKEKVENQIKTFREGIPFVQLVNAAVIGEGITKIDNEIEMAARFDEHSKNLTLLKFVPASGAASRMFKAMFNFIDTYDPKNEKLEEYINRTKDKAVKQFVDEIEKLPFYQKIMGRIGNDFQSEGEMAHSFVKEMLQEDGLNYGFYPKGLLPFHKYDDGSATPFEEHLKEAARYAKSNGTANLHFTISPQHEKMFADEESKAAPKIAKRTDTEFEISYSNQKSSTDTIAVNTDNTPFRNSDGSILFRPGGHGALIENLNEQEADIIFIKNIDNVVIEENLAAVANSKKILGGLLLYIQAQMFDYARRLESDSVSEELINATKRFLEERLNVHLAIDFDQLEESEKIKALKKKLNRPLRICGMVKNEGEPGGGPFFIKDSDGAISLQIIESAQIDMNDKEQVAILKNSTHFNPVDIVCGVKDHNGNKYNLLDYVDSKQGFITGKTKEGKELKALELPGLWNGAMAFWNTIFVEVPLVTFNPVKTVNDLLKPSHQV